MMNAMEIALTWKTIVQIYKETRDETPGITVNEIVSLYGIDKAKEVFATVAAIKKYDGRIYDENRKYMDGIPVDQEIVELRNGNPLLYAGLDDIHTAHINQMITELRKLDK